MTEAERDTGMEGAETEEFLQATAWAAFALSTLGATAAYAAFRMAEVARAWRAAIQAMEREECGE